MPTLTHKGRYFTFTDFKLLDKKAIYEQYSDDIRGIAWALENCPTTGREHHQGFLQTYAQSRFGKIKTMLGKETHIEAMLGTVLDNTAYCEKAGKLTILGEFTKQGRRTDIDAMKSMLAAGKPMIDVMESNPGLYLRYHAGFDKMKSMYDIKLRQGHRDIEATAIIGLAGSGKTHHVLTTYPDAFVLDSGATEQFTFNGYDGQDVILLDDFNGWVKYTTLLRILDGWKQYLNIKGGATMSNWSKVFITSNVRPTYWYQNVMDTTNLQRRINHIYEVKVDEDGKQGLFIEHDKWWAWDRLKDTPYEGKAY